MRSMIRPRQTTALNSSGSRIAWRIQFAYTPDPRLTMT